MDIPRKWIEQLSQLHSTPALKTEDLICPEDIDEMEKDGLVMSERIRRTAGRLSYTKTWWTMSLRGYEVLKANRFPPMI